MYANVIVDISHEKLDKTFQYSIPDEILCDIRPGVCVDIPFGSRTITGYVIEVTDKPEYDPARTKPLIGVRQTLWLWRQSSSHLRHGYGAITALP